MLLYEKSNSCEWNHNFSLLGTITSALTSSYNAYAFVLHHPFSGGNECILNVQSERVTELEKDSSRVLSLFASIWMSNSFKQGNQFFMTVIHQQANQILASYAEGEIAGVIKTIQYYYPNTTREEIGRKLKEICKETHALEVLEYYINYFDLIES